MSACLSSHLFYRGSSWAAQPPLLPVTPGASAAEGGLDPRRPGAGLTPRPRCRTACPLSSPGRPASLRYFLVSLWREEGRGLPGRTPFLPLAPPHHSRPGRPEEAPPPVPSLTTFPGRGRQSAAAEITGRGVPTPLPPCPSPLMGETPTPFRAPGGDPAPSIPAEVLARLSLPGLPGSGDTHFRLPSALERPVPH